MEKQMKTLYFYSHIDEEIRHSTIQTKNQVSSIINELPNEYFLSFLLYKTKSSNPEHLLKCQNLISQRSIQIILDAAGCNNKRANDGAGLNKILLHKFTDMKLLFALADRDIIIAEYLSWVIGNYIKLFNFNYGELILIVSDDDDLNLLPSGFKPIKYKPDNRVFYTKHNHDKTRKICEACGINISKGNILTLFPSTLLLALIQLLVQGTDLIGEFMVF